MACVVCQDPNPTERVCSNFIFKSNGRIDQCPKCKSAFIQRLPKSQVMTYFFSLQLQNEIKKHRLIQRPLVRFKKYIQQKLFIQHLLPLLLKQLKPNDKILKLEPYPDGLTPVLQKMNFDITTRNMFVERQDDGLYDVCC
ncbi:MAG: hypothetical protein HY390_04840, partial [Deltaproteobacteria bacterium]|nr:hypothetical protein [Deltaproteobacteria bacterium]